MPRSVAVFGLLVLSSLCAATHGETLSLAGSWRFMLGGAARNAETPPELDSFSDTIQLPGTTDENQKGPENPARETGRLTRLHPYTGPAWYDRDVTIGQEWRDQRIVLFLERTKYTRVFVDDRPQGSQDSLACPHVYDLTAALAPGKHRLTILVDNSRRPPVGDPHQLSDQTQTNWNGIIGRIELQAMPRVWIDDVQVYPDVAARKVRARITIGNMTGKPTEGELDFCEPAGPHVVSVSPAHMAFKVVDQSAVLNVECNVPKNARLWDEFHPNLIPLLVSATINVGGRSTQLEEVVLVGLRDFKAKGTQFAVNGRTTFLRGKHDACVFPLTGHPPMDVAGWSRYLTICKSYGINHVRFHTWCPPDAAFTAADKLGVYLQPELPNWRPFDGKSEHDRYLRAEADRILQTYGNHPSFVMLSLGNEMAGSSQAMAAIIAHLQAIDPRHLYAQGSNNWFWKPKLAQGDDYWTTVRTLNERGKVRSVRGSFADADAPCGHVQTPPFSADFDYRAAIAGVPVPVIGHEVGQYTVYPDFREIGKYTGVLRARNFEIIRGKLKAQGMLDQADDFVRASGALAVICYREEVEAALRTPGFGGFQLLDLQDFPGQGTALVGILNAFMESKGLIDPATWRECCAETVVLARFSKYTWSNDETFSATVEVANYGPADIPQAAPSWSLVDSRGQSVASSKLPARDIPQGGVTSLGSIHASLAACKRPEKLTLCITIPRGETAPAVVNHYDIWVYPAGVELAPPRNVVIAYAWNKATQELLAAGKRVLLVPDADLPGTLPGGFATDFWCWPMFHNQPGTMGLLCNPRHAALKEFPTEFHSDWQWANIACADRPVVLDKTPADFRPIVQVVDNFGRNHKLGLVFEARVGPGRLLVCSCDLPGLHDCPEARQLFRSLLDYAASDAFRPASSLPPEVLQSVLGGKNQ